MVRFVAAGLPVLHVAAIVAPAMVLAGAARKGGLPWAHGLDLLAVSAAVGLTHAALVRRRIRTASEDQRAACIASANGLVVVALLTTAGLFLGLGGLAPEHAAAVNKGWHVVAAWGCLQVAAVLLSTWSRQRIAAWLRRDGARRGAPNERPGNSPSEPGRSPAARYIELPSHR